MPSLAELRLLFESAVSDPGSLGWGVVVFVGLATFLFTLGIVYVIGIAIGPARKRLLALTAKDKIAQDGAAERLGRRLEGVKSYILPSKDWEQDEIKVRLVQAGYRSDQALVIFFFIKTALGVLLPIIVFLAIPYWEAYFNKNYSGMHTTVIVVAASFIGLMGPNFVLSKIIANRKHAVGKGFPDALDMIVVCVEAGISLAAAVQRVALELRTSHPRLAEEFDLVNAEIRVGVDRVEALRNMGQRTGVDDIRIFAGILGQTMKFGTNIANTLRTYSEDFRDKRMQKAEETAAKIGTKMIFPLVTCLFPAFFVVAVAPAIIKVLAAFK